MQDMTVEKGDISGIPAEPANVEEATVRYPAVSKPLLLLFCGYVVIWYLQIGYRIPALGDIRFEFIYAALLTVLAFFFTPKIPTDAHFLPYIVLFFIVIIIQVPFSYDFDTSWDVFIDRIVKFAFMAFFIIAFVRSPTGLKYFLSAFLLACLKMGQEGFTGLITGSLLWENQGIMRLHGATPNYEHPNSFAGMALGTLPFVYYLWPVSNKKEKIVLILIGIFSATVVLYTGSRTGYVGVVAFLLFIFFTSEKKAKFLVVSTILIVSTLPLIPSDYTGRFDSIFTEKDKEGHSIEMRKQILEDAWEIFTENPLGIGVRAFPKKRMDTFGRSQDTHNLYLEIATNLGIQGLVVVSLFIYKMLAVLRRVKSSAQNLLSKITAVERRSNSALVKDLKLIKAAALATGAFIYIRLALGLFGMDMYEIYWWFALGIAVSLYGMMNRIASAVNGIGKDEYDELSK
jgi:putative inorganic carbon (HCO3(-)) transporter